MANYRIRISLLFILVCALCQAQDSLIMKADKAYMDSEYPEALECYLEAMEEHGSSSQLLYNIGNTYYRLGELGQAALYYKKALKLDPSNADARANLTFLQTKLIDEQTNTGSWSTKIKESILFQFSPNGWAVTGLIFFILFLVILWIYLHSDEVRTRKLSFFGGLCILTLTVLTTIAAFETSAMARNDREAIIITPAIQLSTVPRLPQDKSEEAFMLHEGALVEIIDSLSVPSDSINPLWFEVKVNNEHRAWISATNLRRI